MDIYERIARLNQRQKEAVMHMDGPLLILAGAGSGKTRVITMRAAYLIHRGIKPDSILAVTFTNKAAKEMKERVKGMIRKKRNTPVVSTFHSFCLHILRKEIEHIGYKQNFTIYDTSEQVSLVRDILSDIKFHDESFKAENILERISKIKNGFPLQETDDFINPLEKATSLIYPKYLGTMKTLNVLDFDDLLLLTVKLFKEHRDILKKYREEFRYIMIDEYQDTNRVQYDFIRLLAGKGGNICVVGDDDQSIYGWRGADINNILDFEKDFPDTIIVRLEQNYRSFDHILKAANGVIQNNKKRMEKTLTTKRGHGPKVNIFKALDTEDEADWVINRLITIKTEKDLQFDDIAVIYRANTFSRPFEEALRRQRVPYSVVGGTGYFERREIKDLTAYLKIMANPSDDLSLLRAANAPRRGLGTSALDQLSEYAHASGGTLLNTFGRANEISGLSKKAADSANSLFDLIGKYRKMFDKGREMGDSLKQLIEEINYKDYIISLYKTPEASYRRNENIEGLIESVTDYEKKEISPSLLGFLQAMALTDMLEERDEKERRGVTLISLHSSKGLEFPVVFISGVEEDMLPHKKSADSDEGIEEERRLFYVGITRAMKELFITYTEFRAKYGKKRPSAPSRFLEEIPENVVKRLDRFEETDPEEERAYVKKLYAELMAKLDGK